MNDYQGGGVYSYIGVQNDHLSKRALGRLGMRIRKVEGGYRWGTKGKVYKRKHDALRQARRFFGADYASEYKRSSKRGNK